MTADEDGQPKLKWSGLCIGGPLAGSWVTHDDPHYRCVEREPFDPMDRPTDISTATVKTNTYKWIVGFRHKVKGEWSEDVLNFWIPADKDWNPLDCVRMMAEDYANYHDLCNS